MTIIEIILPDGSIHAHLTAERDAALIAQEVQQRYPEASHWRVGRGWQGVGATRSLASAAGLWLRAALVAAALLAAVALLLPLRQSMSGAAGAAPASAAEEQPAAAAEQAAPARDENTAPALASKDIVVTGVAEQSSDTSRTLLVTLQNTGSQTHADVKLQATFYNRQGQAVPSQQAGGAVTLAPGQRGSVKVWAQSANGIARYELEVLD